MSSVLPFPKKPADYLVVDGGRINGSSEWFWVDYIIDGASVIVWSGRHYEDALACAGEIARDERLRIVDKTAEARPHGET